MEDHTTEHTEHTEVSTILCALCALCGNNIPYTGGWRIIPQSTQSTQRFLPFSVPSVRSVVTIYPTREDGGSYHGAHRAHRGFSDFSVPSVLSVVTIYPTREDHTTEHTEYTEVSTILRALCALCGNNIPCTGGSYHGAHRGCSNSPCPLWEQSTQHGRIIPQSTQSTQRLLQFSVPAVGTIHPAREDHTTEHTEHTEVSPISPCPLCSLW